MRGSRLVAVGVVTLTLVGGSFVLRATADTTPPGLAIGESVAGDFAEVATDMYAEFVAAAPGVAECVGGMRLEAVYELDELALYDQDTGVLFIRVPATEASLRASLVHEFAHHAELACPHHLELRPEFLLAQGLDPATPWFGGAEWDAIPSEQFAEAVVQVVLGARMRHRLSLRLESAAVDEVAGWLATER